MLFTLTAVEENKDEIQSFKKEINVIKNIVKAK
jgi:hypothetical protein